MERRGQAKDKSGRTWTGVVVRKSEAAEADFSFWYEQLTPDQRVEAVSRCLDGAMKTRGPHARKRLRRVLRVVKRKRR
jgi:hypothetical protein